MNNRVFIVDKKLLDDTKTLDPEFLARCLEFAKLMKSEESLEDVEPFDWSEDVLFGKKKISVDMEE